MRGFLSVLLGAICLFGQVTAGASETIIPGKWEFTYETVKVTNETCWRPETYETYTREVDISVNWGKYELLFGDGQKYTGTIIGNTMIYNHSENLTALDGVCKFFATSSRNLVFSGSTMEGQGVWSQTFLSRCSCSNGTTTVIDQRITGKLMSESTETPEADRIAELESTKELFQTYLKVLDAITHNRYLELGDLETELIDKRNAFKKTMNDQNNAHIACKTGDCDIDKYFEQLSKDIAEHSLLALAAVGTGPIGHFAVTVYAIIKAIPYTSCVYCFFETSWAHPKFVNALWGYNNSTFLLSFIDLYRKMPHYNSEKNTILIPEFMFEGAYYWIELSLTKDGKLEVTGVGEVP